MGFYPAFALFRETPPLAEAVLKFESRLRASGTVDTVSPVGRPGMTGYYLQGPHLDCELWKGNTDWCLDFWDFEPEIYDADGPTREMALTKRAAALRILEELVHLGAWLAFVSAAEDNFAGSPSPWDLAELISAAYQRNDLDLVRSLLTPGMYWLIACDPEDPGLAGIRQALDGSFQPVAGQAGCWESRADRPLFMAGRAP